MEHGLKTWLNCVFIAALFCGGCCIVRPGQDQIEAWIGKELPPGSSETEVRSFCRRHAFAYQSFPETKTVAELWRPLEGCEWEKPVCRIWIGYDDKGRLIEAKAEVFGRPMY
jgi:hypothetical protein